MNYRIQTFKSHIRLFGNKELPKRPKKKKVQRIMLWLQSFPTLMHTYQAPSDGGPPNLKLYKNRKGMGSRSLGMAQDKMKMKKTVVHKLNIFITMILLIHGDKQLASPIFQI